MVSRWCTEYKNGQYREVDVAVIPDFNPKENEPRVEEKKVSEGRPAPGYSFNPVCKVPTIF